MTPDKIRQIVREEISRSNASSRFRYDSVPHHTHNGTDSLQIKNNDIIPGVSVSGSITFQSADTYILYFNAPFTPKQILCTGNAQTIGGATNRYFFIGTAQLGPSFYFQPQDNRTVIAGGPQYPFRDPNHPEYGTNIPMQSTAYWGSESAGGTRHTLAGNFHLIDIQYPIGTSHARATVTDFNKNSVTIVVDALDAGWEINANIVIT